MTQVKIISKKAGIGNQIQLIPVIRSLQRHGFKVVSDSMIYRELDVCGYSSDHYHFNIVCFGYNFHKVMIERLSNPGGYFIGFKYRIKRKPVPFGLSMALDFDQTKNEVENNMRLLNYFVANDDHLIEFNIRRLAYYAERNIALGISAKPGKAWQGWTELAKKLQLKNYNVYAFGDDHVYNAFNPYTHSLSHVKEQFENMGYFIGCDCGLMHLADAMEIPAVVLFGACHPHKNRPYHRHVILEPAVSCAPCYGIYGQINDECSYQCMNYSVEEVYDAFHKLVSLSKHTELLTTDIF